MAHWFAQPWLLLSLAGLPLLMGLMFWSSSRRRRALLKLGPRIARLDSLPRPRGWMRLRRLCVGLGLVLLGLGLAGPQWGRDWGQSAAPGRDLMVVVDCSRSMLAETPNRLQRAQTALLDLVQALQKGGGHRVGLVVFAGKAKLLCPLTHDYDHFRSALEEKLEGEPFDPDLGPAAGSGGAPEESGTRIGLGLHEAIRFHGKHQGARDILLLSDGDDPARDGEWQYGIDEAREQGIPVFTVGLGDPDDAAVIRIGGIVQQFEGKEVQTRLEEAPLRQIAQQTGGQYIPARTRALPLGQVYLDLVAGQVRREQSDDILPVYRQRYPWFLVPAFVLLVLSMVLPEQGRKSRALG
jgi:Ca-activated chloride channel family protein